jgi:hypothetical protein
MYLLQELSQQREQLFFCFSFFFPYAIFLLQWYLAAHAAIEIENELDE